MKVLHINTNYTGTTLHKAMIDRMQTYCRNFVFVPTHDGQNSVVPIGEDVTVSQCFRKWDRVLFSYKQRKILRAAERTYTFSGIDLLHAYTLFTDGNVAYELHRKYGIPYVVAVRNTDVNAFFKYRPHLRGRGIKILRNAAAVFFLSASYKNQVIGHWVPEKYRQEILAKSHLIPNGIDPYWFTTGAPHRKTDHRELRLVYAGNIDRNKNITTSARSCELLKRRGYDVSLTVIGKVRDRAAVEELSAYPFVQILPPMTKEELAETYVEKDIFVMPSHYESFGLVYAEAMSQGLPVVYSRGQGFDGQFPEGTVGFGVKSDDAVEIADRIETILKEYDAMSLRCVECSQTFRWEAFAASYYEIYQRCMG